MGFHRRTITNDLVRRCCESSGASHVLQLYRADSLRLDIGIASDIHDLINSHTGEESELIYKIQKKIRDDKKL